ncbi:MAG TPA: hypothetical protein VLJ61_05820 [Pyrinomonadaceae bacterium]|nr:hypothetical protein [Pyrinomonadaceae bacterium]
MYDTSGSHSVCYAAPPDYDIDGRMNWLKAEIARAEACNKPSRVREENRALSIMRPLTTKESYTWFGTFLGLFPPFALFARILAAMFSGGASRRIFTADDPALLWVLLFLTMNTVCCLVGRKFGAFVGRKLDDPRRWTWPMFIFSSLMLAIAWGIVTGAAGGAVGFIIGAVVGVVCAVPVALAAFSVFAVLHRLLSHGGMIDEHDLWPLAFGVPLTVAALILSPGLLK